MASAEKVEANSSDLSDSDTVSLTSTKPSASEEEYELECVLAERLSKGETEYLVKWKDYPHHRNTWEKEENFFQAEATLKDWCEQKMRISRGHAEAFDVSRWERKCLNVFVATQRRKARRREKKIKLGIPVPSPLELSDQTSSSQYSTEADSSEESDGLIVSDAQSRVASPIWTAKEDDTLLQALQRLKKPQYNTIRRWHGPDGIVNQGLERRSEGSLQRKTIAMKREFDASGKDFPIPGLLDVPSSESIGSGKDVDRAKSAKLNRKHARDPTSRRNSMSELVGSLHGTTKPESANVSEIRTANVPNSPRKRRSDHGVAQQIKRPEKPKTRVLASMKKVSETTTISTTPSSVTSPKAPAFPDPASSRLPSHPIVARLDVEQRPVQLGTIGRGPARPGLPHAKITSAKSVNVLENWDAQPKKRRKSRYDMTDLKDTKARSSAKFKKFSTQRKFELAARYEHIPDVNSLTFIDRKDGKPLENPPASLGRKPPAKTPFQLLQERMIEEEGEVQTVLDEPPQSILERTSPTETHIEKPRMLESDATVGQNFGVEDAGTESTVRRASLPFESYAQRKGSGPQPFAAPVAMMSSGKDQSSSAVSLGRQTLLRASISVPLSKAETENGAGSAAEDPLRRDSISALQETDVSVNFSAESGQKKPDKTIDKPGSLAAADPRRQQVSMPLSHKPSQSRAKTHSPATMQASEPTAQPQHVLSSFQPRQDGYALFPLDISGPTFIVDTKTAHYTTDVIADILTGPENEILGKVIFRDLEDFDLKHLFLTIKPPGTRQMNVKCETMCTAGEYATFFHVS